MATGSRNSLTASDEAISESVGYIMILGIIIAALAIIYAVGYPMLEGSIDDSHFENMESGFDIMSDNMARVSTYHAPGQSVELKLRGGTLVSNVTGKYNVTLTYINGTKVEQSWDMMSVIYTLNGMSIGYESGGVLKNDGNNMYVLKEPDIVKGDPYVIPVDRLWSQPNTIAGDGLAKVTIKGSSPSVNQYVGIKEINITVTTEFSEAWAKYFKQSLDMTATYDKGAKVAIGVYKPAVPVDVIVVIKPLSIEIR